MTTLATQAVMPAYARQDVTIVSGDGAWVRDADGRRYLDFLAGIAVVGLGHLHPAPLAAAHSQLEELWHVSNLYWTGPMAELAERLSERFGGGQAFFCNSGAEAIEAALKLARKTTGRHGVVALEGSFHGRTLGALSVTGPAPEAHGVRAAPQRCDVRASERRRLARSRRGRGNRLRPARARARRGRRRPARRVVRRSRAHGRRRTGALLVFDEVQTGVGRTGSFFAFEQLGVRPDAVTLAKGLANGLPIGCLLSAESAFEPGDHASTFGGNPVVCAAAAAVCDEIDEELLAAVRAHGATIAARLPNVRGRGLLLAVETQAPAADVVGECLTRGLLVGTAGEQAIRLTPPLTLTDEELEHGLAILEEVFAFSKELDGQ